MANPSPAAVVGCLLDVSGSMREALDVGHSDDRAINRLRAVLQAALKLAQAEQQHNANAIIFVGVFGLDTDNRCPPVADLCGAVDALLRDTGDGESGHNLLIARANKEGVSHITEYIRKKLTDDEARIVDARLKRHPEQVKEFVDAIPSTSTVHTTRGASQGLGTIVGLAAGTAASAAFGMATGGIGASLVLAAGAAIGGEAGNRAADRIEDTAVEVSEALRLARRICAEWLQDFTKFVPRPVGDVVDLLKRLQQRSEAEKAGENGNTNNSTLLDTLRRYMYGRTPMRDALSRSLMAFKEHPNAKDRVLVLVSDGLYTDDDPMPLARNLQQEGVSIATVYLTSDRTVAHRRLYYQAAETWDNGQRVLFDMAARVAGVVHPIPVLASVEWEIPSAGEVALHATVSSSEALEQFCSLLLSARFGSADALLDVIGRISLDSYINDQHALTCRNPSNQDKPNCYAHAIAAIIHMALLRIVGRDSGYPSIEEIRARIDDEFKPRKEGYNTKKVFEKAREWYPPLRVKEVDENGARQAVLHRRPVLTTFQLSETGWDVFCKHFHKKQPKPRPTLTYAQMAAHRSEPRDDGHAVVLTSCNPDSLTFLNSWGSNWGNNGSFSVENHTVLELDNTCWKYPMEFYDVFWLEEELTAAERHAYQDKANEEWHCHTTQYPSILELATRCPYCQTNGTLASFRVRKREVHCGQCTKSYTLDSSRLVEALSQSVTETR